jgi:hypothetical protein
MKNADFFTEVNYHPTKVASIITEDLIHRNSRLEREKSKLKEEIKKTLLRIRELERNEMPKASKNNDLYRFIGTKTISENLYEKAKIMSEE